MQIRDSETHDASDNRGFVDAYMRWALTAAEEVAGKPGLAIILREAKLDHFIDNYPTDDLKISGTVTAKDYTALCTGLLSFYGRAGKGSLIRIGRRSASLAIDRQRQTFGLDTLVVAARLLPYPAQIKMALEAQMKGFKQIYKSIGHEWNASVEERGDVIAYSVETCGMCVGKEADGPICTVNLGILGELMKWMTGKDFAIEETACRANGAPACVFEISKTPKE